ncbi:MAG: shikimate kinase [Bacteroidota bacterium]|jgi:shikimate kinase
MKKVVYLTGFMGSGKTTVGKKLAAQLNYTFIDLDSYIEQQEGRSISELFNEHGENYFREVEHQCLQTLLKLEKLVIACGGGTPCFYDAMQQMNEHGITVYLQMNVLAIFNRLKQGRMQRPLIAGKSDEALRQYIDEKLKEREPLYLKAQIVVPAIDLNISELKNKIIDIK